MVLVGPGPAPVAAVDGPSIANLVVDSGPFHVDGLLGTALATISVDVHDPTGVGPCENTARLPGHDVTVLLTRTSGGTSDTAEVYLGRSSGETRGPA